MIPRPLCGGVIHFIEGRPLNELMENRVVHLAETLKKLHTSVPMNGETPYICEVFDEFANGEDKQIEKYVDLPGIEKIVDPYNRIRTELGDWFHSLQCFADCQSFCLCHADLKKENILETPNGKVFLIDWECAGSDIPETDIGRLFAGCDFTESQQELFLSRYFGESLTAEIRERIMSVKIVLDFFRILEDYILLKRKSWDADAMLGELMAYEEVLKSRVIKSSWRDF